ncbi:hypothetical protein HMPREF9093_00915 [Fusobacterium sp. oral taxon 370 str. F0437]|uniref:hypothetical protein n=1 Tax=Fusobacterium sp. oral taxon 370 TaxID=712288 RepID=UPI000234A6D9|nr:hypothetical protein [Fusobacterium sp. oral taxon 370]EHI78831.1 hypothetical protein HMPREF9093_00915 [Fusobacterium sp. oral taxon 370 str. F0437]
MKKFILGLFLILGAVSFAVPKFINTTKLENAGYSILQDREDIFTFGVSDKDSALMVSFYLSDKSPKELSDAIKAEAPSDAKFIATFNNDRAYVNEFKNDDLYSYHIVSKKQKIKGYHIYATYASPKKLSKEAVDATVKFVLDDVESFIK